MLGQEDVDLLSGDQNQNGRTDGAHVSSFERKCKLNGLVGPNERTSSIMANVTKGPHPSLDMALREIEKHSPCLLHCP